MNPVAIANLLSLLIPLSVRAYNEIRATHAELKPVEEILAGADANWDAVIARANEELAKPRRPGE